jgi:hypothetical protein
MTDVTGAVFFHAELRVGRATMRDRDGGSAIPLWKTTRIKKKF